MSQTITVRTNLYLWMLTGRSDDYVNSGLNTGIRYSIKSTPDEVKQVRELLNLSNTDTDFWVLGALAAARMSTSLLREMPRENDAVFPNGLLSLPGISSSSQMLPPAGDVSWPSLDGGAAGAGRFTQVTLTSDGSDTLITTDAGGPTVRSAHTLTAVSGGFRLSVEKASEFGINADFKVAQWNASDLVTVTLTPTRYPFADVAATLLKNTVAVRLMNSEGTLQAFSESSNPAKKVGMAALAIIRRMIRAINEDQAGFEITTSYDESSDEPLQKRYEIDPTFVAGLTDPEVNDEAPVGFDA